MPGGGLRALGADIVGPGGDGGQIAALQELLQVFPGGSGEVVPGYIRNDAVALVSPSPCLGVGQSSREAVSTASPERRRCMFPMIALWNTSPFVRLYWVHAIAR